MTKLAVDIWSDVMCPWCAVGYTQFAKALDLLEGEVEVEICWMPFELNPDMPAEGKSQVEHLAGNYGRSTEEVKAMQEQMANSAAEAGFPMNFEGPDGKGGWVWNTFEAHKLLRWALVESGPDAQTRLKLALFRAHFQQSRNVSDREVLLDLAQAEGFDREKANEALDDEALSIATRMEQKRGLEAGIASVPTFVINGKYMLQGSQQSEKFRKALLQLASMEEAA